MFGLMMRPLWLVLGVVGRVADTLIQILSGILAHDFSGIFLGFCGLYFLLRAGL